MMNGVELFKSIREKESKVRELQHSDPRSNEREVLDSLNRLRKAYRALLVQHVDELYEIGSGVDNLTPIKDSRDIPGHVWRSCFYKQISEFRGALKRHTANLVAVQSADRRTSLGSDAGAVQREQMHIARLTQGLLSFLSDSINYFQRIVHELEERARTASGPGAEWLRRCSVSTVYRCLLYLGDLSRYREMYSERTQKDFSQAMRYYERAALLEPGSGNAQNQLAVLATYCEADCVAAYHHCRSILSVTPFSSGFENLSALLAKNAVAARALAVGAKNQGTKLSAKRAGPVQLSDFLTRFLQVHGVLFGCSTRMHSSYAQMLGSQQSSGLTCGSQRQQQQQQQHWAPTLSPSVTSALGVTGGDDSAVAAAGSGELEDRFAAMLLIVLEEFDEQLSAGSIQDVLLVRLLAICVFSVHYAAGGEANLLGWQDSVYKSEGLAEYTRAQGEHPRSTAEALALTALFGLVNRTATRLAAAANSSARGARSLLNRSLPMLAVFATWAASHPDYLDPRQRSSGDRPEDRSAHFKPAADIGHSGTTDESVAPPAMFADSSQTSSAAADPDLVSSQRWEETYLASTAAERTEARARSAVKAALAEAAPLLEAEAARAAHKKGNDGQALVLGAEAGGGLLREHFELRGFLPVAARVEDVFQGFDPLAETPQLLPDTAARLHRARAVLDLVSSIRAGQPGARVARRQTTAATAHSEPVAVGDARTEMGPSKGQRQRGTSNSATKAKQRAAPARSASPDLPRPAPPAPVRGPPAVPTGVARLHEGSPQSPEQALPLSPLDFPALPSRVPAVISAGTGTGTQREDEDEDEDEDEEEAGTGEGKDSRPVPVLHDVDEDEDEGLDDVVVFQSAFVRAHGNSSRDSMGGNNGPSVAAVAVGGPAHEGSTNYHGLPLWHPTDLLGGGSASAALQSKGSFFADLGLVPLDNPPFPTAPFGSALFPAQEHTAQGSPHGKGTATGLDNLSGRPQWALGDGLGGWGPYHGIAEAADGQQQHKQHQPQFSEPPLDISFLLDCDTPLPARESVGAALLADGPGQESQLPRWLTEAGTSYLSGPSTQAASTLAPATSSALAAPPPGLNRTAYGSGHSSSASSLAALEHDLALAGAQPTRPSPAPVLPRPPGLG